LGSFVLLKTKQIESLESMNGWCWDVLTLKWEIGVSHLVEYVERVGCPSPPQTYITDDGYKLGNWVNNQRIRKKKGCASEEQIKRLSELGFVWDASNKGKGSTN